MPEPTGYPSKRSPTPAINADDEVPLAPAVFFDPAVSRAHIPREPLSTTHLDVTTDCNFDCPTCIETQYRQTRTYLSYPAICRVLEDIHALGCRDLRLYGGEPTLHPRLPDVITRALEMGFSIRLVTNGSRLDHADLVRAIISSPRVCVRVSINAHTPKTHAAQHGCPSSQFDRIKNRVTALIARGGRVGISYLLTPRSIPELDEACRFWQQAGAEMLSLRMLTAPHGLQSKFGLSDAARANISRVLDRYPGWASFAAGEDWIAAGQPPLQERYSYCYTGYFRLVISPFLAAGPGDEPDRQDGPAPLETGRMWISACPYQRAQPATGCIYPPSLSDWWDGPRRVWLDQLWPRLASCPSTICSRNDLNARIHAALQPGRLP